MIVSTNNYAIKHLNEKYDEVSIHVFDKSHTFICNKGFIRKNTNLMVIPEGCIIDKKSVLRRLFKQYKYRLIKGRVPAKQFNIKHNGKEVVKISNCWVFKRTDLLKVNSRLKLSSASLESVFLVRNTDMFSLKNMNELKDFHPFTSSHKRNLKKLILQSVISHPVTNKDLSFYLLASNGQMQLQIGKKLILQNKTVQKPQTWLQRLFKRPVKLITLTNNHPLYLLLCKIARDIALMTIHPSVAVVGTITNNNVMISGIYKMETGIYYPYAIYKDIARLTGWYIAKDVKAGV